MEIIKELPIKNVVGNFHQILQRKNIINNIPEEKVISNFINNNPENIKRKKYLWYDNIYDLQIWKNVRSILYMNITVNIFNIILANQFSSILSE